MKKKVFVVGSQTNYIAFIEGAELVEDMKDADIILFTGGEDVSPSYYGSPVHPMTYSNSKRDAAEKRIYESIKPSQLAIGICRGLI